MKYKSESWASQIALAKKFSWDLIEIAMVKAPTGGNSKPFSWQWIDQRLLIRHDLKLAEHYLNRNQHASWIALGCLLESVETAARYQGFKSQVLIMEDLGAEVTFTAIFKNEDQAMYEMESLLKRRTYRGPLQTSAAPAISQKHSKSVQVRIASAQSLSNDFKKYLISTDAYLWLQKKAMQSFFKEVRFFDPHVEPRGIRSEDLGIGMMDQMMLYFFSFVPWLLSLIIRVPVLNQNFKTASKRTLENAHFLLVTATALDSRNLVQAGQAAMAAWIELENRGYKLQPYSTASLTLVAAKTGHLHRDTLKKFVSLFGQHGPQILRDQFQLGVEENPVWILRVGKAK